MQFFFKKEGKKGNPLVMKTKNANKVQRNEDVGQWQCGEEEKACDINT